MRFRRTGGCNEVLEGADGDDDPVAEAERRKLPTGHEFVRQAARDSEPRCGLRHAQREAVLREVIVALDARCSL